MRNIFCSEALSEVTFKKKSYILKTCSKINETADFHILQKKCSATVALVIHQGQWNYSHGSSNIVEENE